MEVGRHGAFPLYIVCKWSMDYTSWRFQSTLLTTSCRQVAKYQYWLWPFEEVLSPLHASLNSFLWFVRRLPVL